jgi:hypothetical protein
VLIQSFWPPNLDVAQQRGFDTSLLSLSPTNAAAPELARARGFAWVSPAWPFDAAHVSRAHALGLRVVPYGLDGDADLRAAAAAHVDELVTNDPVRAARVLAGTGPRAADPPRAPTRAACAATRASRRLPAIEAYDPQPGAPRVFAMQFKQEIRHVLSYATYRRKIECLIREYVLPRVARDRPNVVAFTEDVGLATIATGSRGAGARVIAEHRDLAAGCASAGAPCATLAALESVGAAYGPQMAAYQARFTGLDPVSGVFVAATDTFARGWMQTFSDLARRYRIYILGSNDQAPFRESTDPAEIALFADPDLPRRPESVYVATNPKVYNEVFLWGPRDVRNAGPRPLRNVVATNKKVPLTPIELQLNITPGPASGPDAIANLEPYTVPGTQARIGFATSLPAFVYGDLPEGADPCTDVARFYMRCLDRLGANLVMQDEANPGQWAYGGVNGGAWQPMEWMRSTWRAVAEPDVRFSYNVTAHMVGNLVDLPFDGQTAITQRGLGAASGRTCHYVGNSRFLPGADPENVTIAGETLPLAPFAGPKAEFVALAPWVTPDGPRDQLRQTAAALSPDGNGRLENDYLETAVVADLPFPPDPRRRSCATADPR